MAFLQATERTLNAIRKADALASTSKMIASSKLEQEAPTMMPTNIYGISRTIAVDPGFYGEFFPNFIVDEFSGMKVSIGTLDVRRLQCV